MSGNDVIPVHTGRSNKKSGAFGLFKAAMLMMRRKRPRENKAAKHAIAPDDSSNANWTKLVGSMRPLHMRESTPSSPDEEIIVPASPCSASTSRYASALSLRDLLDSSDDEEEDPDQVFDAVCGDEMIDVKAEEFIEKFYQQMRIQNTNNRAINH